MAREISDNQDRQFIKPRPGGEPLEARPIQGAGSVEEDKFPHRFTDSDFQTAVPEKVISAKVDSVMVTDVVDTPSMQVGKEYLVDRKNESIPHTRTITEALLEAYTDGDSWEDGTWRAVDSLAFGLTSTDDTLEEKIQESPARNWIASVHGMKIIPSPTEDNPDRVTIEALPVEDMITFQQKLAEGPLAGENARVPQLIDPIEPELGICSLPNTNQWLEAAKNGGWAIMKDEPLSDGTFTHSTHDLGLHLGNVMLFPKEIQDLITQTAEHEYKWRMSTEKTSGSIDSSSLLAGEPLDSGDPWSESDERTNGAEKIDRLTDALHYGALLTYLIDTPDDKVADRLDQVREAALQTERQKDTSLLSQSVSGLKMLSDMVRDLANFNMRHEEGRNITQAEADNILEQSFAGIVRVAQKIRRS